MRTRTIPAPRPVPLTEADQACRARLGRDRAAGTHGRFAVVLGCIDGRAQDPVTGWVRQAYGVDHVDVVTEPGMDRVLAHGGEGDLEALLDKVCVSRLAHHAGTVVVAGHHDCAANPVDDAQHEADVARSVDRVWAALPGIDVVGAFVDDRWSVRPLAGAPDVRPRRWWESAAALVRLAHRERVPG